MKKTKSNKKIPAKDMCQTPPYALEPLYPYLPKGTVVWESACGEGLLVQAMLDKGYKVKWSDVERDPRENFFAWEPLKGFDVQVTNPPFSLKYAWMERSYKLGKPFALLMPVDVIAAKSAHKLWEKFGIEILLLDARVDFKMPNKGWEGKGSDFSVEWFTWGLNIGRTFTFVHLPKPKKETNGN